MQIRAWHGACSANAQQCDEMKPACSNCLRHDIACDYKAISPASLSPATPDLEQPVHNSRRYRFKPSQYQSRVDGPGNTVNESTGPAGFVSTGTQCDFPTRVDGLSLADLQLFHRFVTSTYRTLAEDAHGHALWQIHVPQWSLDFPSIMHLILALSAIHQSRDNPDAGVFVDQADQHFTFGVSSVTSILSQFDLTPENAQPLYLAAALICIIYFAHGPRPGEYIIFSDAGHAEWLVLLRGVRLIIETQKSHLFKGPMEPRPTEIDDLMKQRRVNPEWQSALDGDRQHLYALQQLVQNTHYANVYGPLVENLLESFGDVYVKMSVHPSRVGLMQYVVGWLYRLPDEYIGLLEQKEPCALVILAAWSILLHYMQPVWYMRDWDVHVIHGILHTVHDDWKDWVSWPLKRIESVAPSDN